MSEWRPTRGAFVPGEEADDLPSSLSERTTVGCREWMSLPDWGIARIRVKIDTGARTSALHVENLEILPDGRLSFDVVLDRKESPRTVRVVAAESVRTSTVRPSNGVSESRHIVETRMRLGEVEKTIEVGLVDRGPMLYRMLVGRRALGADFVIQPDEAYLLSGPRPLSKERELTLR